VALQLLQGLTQQLLLRRPHGDSVPPAPLNQPGLLFECCRLCTPAGAGHRLLLPVVAVKVQPWQQARVLLAWQRGWLMFCAERRLAGGVAAASCGAIGLLDAGPCIIQ
jgi:hypothetical protein